MQLVGSGVPRREVGAQSAGVVTLNIRSLLPRKIALVKSEYKKKTANNRIKKLM
jgi:hypothetical protein